MENGFPNYSREEEIDVEAIKTLQEEFLYRMICRLNDRGSRVYFCGLTTSGTERVIWSHDNKLGRVLSPLTAMAVKAQLERHPHFILDTEIVQSLIPMPRLPGCSALIRPPMKLKKRRQDEIYVLSGHKSWEKLS